MPMGAWCEVSSRLISYKKLTFKPLALLIARSGRKTLRIRNTLSIENI